MSSSLLALLAFAPILSAAILLVGFRIPAKKAMPICLVFTAIMAFAIWNISPRYIAASSILLA